MASATGGVWCHWRRRQAASGVDGLSDRGDDLGGPVHGGDRPRRAIFVKDFIIRKDFYTYSIKILRQEKAFVIIAAVIAEARLS